MSFERMPDPMMIEDLEAQTNRAPQFYSVNELKSTCELIEDPEDRELMVGLCEDLRRQNRHYLNKVMAMEAGDKDSHLDQARRNTHNSIISTLTPIARFLGGEYQADFLELFTTDNSPETIDRRAIGLWALSNALEQLQGELYEQRKQLGNAA